MLHFVSGRFADGWMDLGTRAPCGMWDARDVCLGSKLGLNAAAQTE